MRRPAAVDLVGRTAELDLIDSMLDGQDRVGPGLLIRGHPGIGKTALLDAAAVRAGSAGARVLRVSGVEYESDIGFSALHQMLYPLRDRIEELAGHHRDTLHQVFDLAPEPSPHPLAASTAVLAILSMLAEERPLAVLADDLPWIDEASATALGFAARRIGHDPIVFLATARTGADGFCDRIGLPERVIEPLDDEAGVEAPGQPVARAGADRTTPAAGRGRRQPARAARVAGRADPPAALRPGPTTEIPARFREIEGDRRRRVRQTAGTDPEDAVARGARRQYKPDDARGGGAGQRRHRRSGCGAAGRCGPYRSRRRPRDVSPSADPPRDRHPDTGN